LARSGRRKNLLRRAAMNREGIAHVVRIVAMGREVAHRIVVIDARSAVPPVQVDRRRVADRARRQVRVQAPEESVASLPVIVARARAAATIVVVRARVVMAGIVVRVFNRAGRAEDMAARAVTAGEADRIAVRTTVRTTR
jgi:hypothetical protein